jgi:hypothetical protein
MTIDRDGIDTIGTDGEEGERGKALHHNGSGGVCANMIE